MTKEKRKPIKGIYILSCPDTGEVRYIGQSKDTVKRFTGHRAAKGDCPCPRWIKGLKANGKLPKMTLVFESDELDTDEVELISQYRAMGARLLNVSDGGKTDGFASTPEPWVDSKTKKSPSIMFFMLWSQAASRDRSRYFQKSKPLKDLLKTLDGEDRMRREISIAESIYDAVPESVSRWFQAVFPDIQRLYPVLAKELRGN